eukprot:scaffold81587_cov26-Cyclotella_meneghiniana.AAC.1
MAKLQRKLTKFATNYSLRVVIVMSRRSMMMMVFLSTLLHHLMMFGYLNPSAANVVMSLRSNAIFNVVTVSVRLKKFIVG